MTMVAMTFVLIGAMLGLRIKVFVLLPIIISNSMVIFDIGFALDSGIWSIVLAAVVIITALEIGYLVGAVIYFAVTMARVRGEMSGIAVVPPGRADPISIED